MFLAQPAEAQTATKPAPVAALIRQVDIPYTQFTLANGLRVIVHTDRKAPIVAVSVWYNVGSKFEPKGKTGFAHLFEHLMFNGSENAPGDFYAPLKQVGGTDMNGSTYFDRTNYYETVPTTALDRALFLESDRMGYLLGAVTQGTLDRQRGVVQNEKRQGDNRPYGLVQYRLTEGLFPADHPYGHTTIGSMADLDAASLADVKDWFRSHYGPNNTVLVLAGDIDAATAKPLVEKYFAAIPRGPENVLPKVDIPTLAVARSEVMKDRVGATMLIRAWSVPGLNDTDSTALDVAAGVLGGLSSSRLDNALVRGEKLAVNVSASNASFSQLGTFTVRAVVRPGVDPAVVAKRLDAIVADFLKTGPTADEVARYVTQTVSGTIAGLEKVGGGGKARVLAEGALYSNDPGFFKKQLLDLAAETPAHVRAVTAKWLSRPVYALTVEPGAREAYVEAAAPAPAPVAAKAEPAAKGTRGAIPPAGAAIDLTYPKIERAKLSNGIEIVYAQRDAVPFTRAVLNFDAGLSSDVAGKSGTAQLAMAMLTEGTDRFDSTGIAEAKERLGAGIGVGMSADRTSISFGAPSANLLPVIDLFADIVRHPAFAAAEIERKRNAQLADIAQELTDPRALANRVLPPLLYGAASPYAKANGGGDPAALAALTRGDLLAYNHAWVRPDKARIFVVSDRPLAEVTAAFERGFGDWTGIGAPGVKTFATPPAPTTPKIVLIDRPDSPQSVILGALPNARAGTDELLPVIVANDALGGGFLARINMNLREDKHWAYGASGSFSRLQHAAPYFVNAPVQANKTGAAIAELRKELSGYVGAAPMTQAEFDRAIADATRSLPGEFETSNALLGAMQNNDLWQRPDDYYATITQAYRALTLGQVTAAARATIDPARAFWIVVGDARVVRPQLDSIGLPVEVIPAASVATAR